MIKFKALFALIGVLLSLSGIAQQDSSQVKPDSESSRPKVIMDPDKFIQADTFSGPRDKEFANPGVLNMGPSKGLILRYERQFDYGFKSEEAQSGLGNANGEVKRSNIAEIKAYIPVWLRPHLKMVLGVSYTREEFYFEDAQKFKEGGEFEYPYYANLQEKGLKSLTTQLVILRPVDEIHYWILRGKGELNGDYTADDRLPLKEYLKYSAEAIYGWKRSPSFSWGLGVQVGYTFGRQSIYPALLYNRTFNERWGIEAIFPAKVKVRYNQSISSMFYAGYAVDGYSYNIKIDDPAFDGLRTLELRHNDLKGYLRWEREILSFLWMAAEGGYRYNVAYDAFETGSKRNVRLITTDVKGAAYGAFEIFLVPPRKRVLKP